MLSVLDQRTIDFVQEYLSSFVVWDLLVYLAEMEDGQTLSSTALADTLGREKEEVEKGLLFLVEKKILQQKETDQPSNFSYIAPEQLKISIKNFVTALDVREKRLAVLTMLLSRCDQ